jgi:hypothetical protein
MITDIEVVNELPLEKVIYNTLVKHNVTDAVINQLKEKYGELRLRDINDKESYLELKQARKETRQIGILTEKLCKQGREDAIRQQKLWLAKEKEILDKISKVQEPLDREIKKFDDEVERKEKEQQRLKEEAYMQRQSTLLKMGAVYAEGCFVLDDVSFEMPLIKESDNDIWEVTILSKYKAAYAKKEAALVEQERIKKEQEEKLKKERAEFEEMQRVLNEERESFRKQQEELKKQKDESERLEREKGREEVRKAEAERQKIQQSRLQVIAPFHQHYKFVDIEGLWAMEESGFLKFVDSLKAKYEEAQKVAEHERNERAQREAEQKRLADEQRKQEELLKAGDKVKYDDIIRQISAITVHEMRSPYYRTKAAIIREKLEEISNL